MQFRNWFNARNLFQTQETKRGKMRKNVMTLFLLLASSFVKGLAPYRKNSMDLVKLKASLFYIKSIKTSRLLFMSLLGVGVCLIFLFGGLILFHATLFLYAPWSAQTKLA